MCSDSAGLGGREESGSAVTETHPLCQHKESFIFKPTDRGFRPQSNAACSAGAKAFFSRKKIVFEKPVVKIAVLIFGVLWVWLNACLA